MKLSFGILTFLPKKLYAFKKNSKYLISLEYKADKIVCMLVDNRVADNPMFTELFFWYNGNKSYGLRKKIVMPSYPLDILHSSFHQCVLPATIFGQTANCR